MAKSWYQVTCNVKNEIADAVAEYLTELSGCGVCTENRNVDAFSPDEIPLQETVTITAYFTMPCQIEDYLSRITAFLMEFVDSADTPQFAPVKMDLISEEDWANSWKDLFSPIEAGKLLLITPSWIKPPDSTNRAVITIDPGMAFGTGGHETTRLCLECIEKIITDESFYTKCGELPILDLGTGSGILAIAAAKLCQSHIDAVDIDPEAVSVAEENCRINGVDNQVSCSNALLETLESGYGLILANILAEELVRLAPPMLQRLAPGAHIVLSGILAEKEEYVVEAFRKYPVRLAESISAGEWRCLHYTTLL